MTVAELDASMSLAEFFEWQAFDTHRAEKAARERADAEAVEAGEPTEDMVEEARRDFEAREETMREQAAREARERGLVVELEEQLEDVRRLRRELEEEA